MDTPHVEGTVGVYNHRGLKKAIPCTRHLIYQNGGAFPGLVVWPDGEILLHCRGQANHGSRVGTIAMRKSKDGGFTWTEPKTIAAKPDLDCRNSMMCILPKTGDLVLLYCDRDTRNPQKTEWAMYSAYSHDRGETWSDHVRIPDPEGYKLISPFAGGNIGVLRDGRMVAPAFVVPAGSTYMSQPSETWEAFMIESKDGLKWDFPTPIVPGWSDEVDISELPEEIGGGLIALNRNGGVHFAGVYRQFSEDYGITWGKPEMVAFDGLHPATSLWIGKELLMTLGCRRYPYGARAVLSTDYGVTFDWLHQIVFADNCGIGREAHDTGYATSVLLPDGYLFSVWYKSHSDKPYFPNTGGVFTCEASRVKWEEVRQAIAD